MSLPSKPWATELTSLTRSGGFVVQYDSLVEAQRAVEDAQDDYDSGRTPNAAAITIYRRDPDAPDGWAEHETVPLGDDADSGNQ